MYHVSNFPNLFVGLGTLVMTKCEFVSLFNGYDRVVTIITVIYTLLHRIGCHVRAKSMVKENSNFYLGRQIV